jgi:hypothetical protein
MVIVKYYNLYARIIKLSQEAFADPSTHQVQVKAVENVFQMNQTRGIKMWLAYFDQPLFCLDRELYHWSSNLMC